MTIRRSFPPLVLVGALSALAVISPGADAASSASRPIPGTSCSVTATEAIASPMSSPTLRYGGGVSCAGSGGERTIDVVPQVAKRVHGRARWFTISLAALYQGPTALNPLRLSGHRKAVAGHVYRVLVFARLLSSDGRTSSATACAGSGCAGFAALSVRPSSTFEARPSAVVLMRGLRCSVSQYGLIFTVVNGSYVLHYGGDTFCSREVSTSARRLTVCAQVANRVGGRVAWHSIAGSCFTRRTSSSEVLTLQTARSAFLGHAYRVKVVGKVTTPTSNGAVTRTLELFSGAAAP